MIKKILKEIGIIILFLFAEAVLLGVLFYGYIPADITIPTKVVPYELSEDIENELNASIIARR